MDASCSTLLCYDSTNKSDQIDAREPCGMHWTSVTANRLIGHCRRRLSMSDPRFAIDAGETVLCILWLYRIFSVAMYIGMYVYKI